MTKIESVVAVDAELMKRDKRHVVVLIAHGIAIIVQVVILLELGIGEAVGCRPRQVVVDRRASQGHLDTATIALASIDHGTSEAVIACHHGELLVANQGVEQRHVGLHATTEEVQMRAALKVPRLLGTV